MSRKRYRQQSRSLHFWGKLAGFSLLCCFWVLIVPVSMAGTSLWQHLKTNEEVIELMGMEPVQDGIVFYGATYSEERQKEPSLQDFESDLEPVTPSVPTDLAEPVLRKLLYIFKINKKENIEWFYSYPAVPDNQEIFSVASSSTGGLCLVFGESSDQDSPLNPIVMQVDRNGKIVWLRNFSVLWQSLDNKKQISPDADGLVANLDTIRVKGSADNGCVMTFVSRLTVKDDVNYNLHVIKHDENGGEIWKLDQDTELYGKLLLERDKKTGDFIIILTNQSRNAAIEAMLKSTPFTPISAVYRVGSKGKMEGKVIQPEFLKNVWVNALATVDNGDILLAGKKGGTWMAIMSPSYKVKKVVERGEHEITAVNAKRNHTFVVATQDEILLVSDLLKQIKTQSLRSNPVHNYSNRFLLNRMPEQINVERILPVGSGDNYLVFFQLGVRLSEIKMH